MDNLVVTHDAVASIEITDGDVLCSDIPAGTFFFRPDMMHNVIVVEHDE